MHKKGEDFNVNGPQAARDARCSHSAGLSAARMLTRRLPAVFSKRQKDGIQENPEKSGAKTRDRVPKKFNGIQNTFIVFNWAFIGLPKSGQKKKLETSLRAGRRYARPY